MKIALDGRILGQNTPQDVRWVEPRQTGTNLDGAPVYAPNWQVSLGFSILSTLQFERWNDACDGDTHEVRLPHPHTGVLTVFDCFVSKVATRIVTTDVCLAASSGCDITLTGITLS